MTHEDHFIVAIELGSSKITAIAGRKQPDGNILILAYVQEPSESFIRKGRIYNFNKTTSCIESMKHKLEERLNKAIGTTYVGIGGMGLHTVSNTVSRQLSEKLLITQQMVNSVIDANNATPGNDREILAVVPQDYKLGAQTVADPVGIATESIEGHFLNGYHYRYFMSKKANLAWVDLDSGDYEGVMKAKLVAVSNAGRCTGQILHQAVRQGQLVPAI